ncbi:MAG: tRNA lysidine(34) synthetase TilS, partial [Rhodothermales bacterium]|nr:tRNA lysidine(34) synthetase TilS [Rhodothermales bacterium]
FGQQALDGLTRSAAHAAAMIGVEPSIPLDELVRVRGDRIELDLAELEHMPGDAVGRLLLRLLRKYFPAVPRTTDTVDAIRALATLQTGRQWVHPRLRVIRDRTKLVFDSAPEVSSGDDNYPQLLGPGLPVVIPGGIIRADILKEVPARLDPGTVLVTFADRRSLSDDLSVDVWRSGDSIEVFGSSGSKKVSDLLTDNKIPHVERQNVRVVRSRGEIVWVVGICRSAQAVVSTATTEAVMLSVMPTDHGIYFRS